MKMNSEFPHHVWLITNEWFKNYNADEWSVRHAAAKCNRDKLNIAYMIIVLMFLKF